MDTPDTPKKGKPRRVFLTDTFISQIRVDRVTRYWDCGPKAQQGLVLSVQPNGNRSFFAYLNVNGRRTWVHIGDCSLEVARDLVLDMKNNWRKHGIDPLAARQAGRAAGTVADV